MHNTVAMAHYQHRILSNRHARAPCCHHPVVGVELVACTSSNNTTRPIPTTNRSDPTLSVAAISYHGEESTFAITTSIVSSVLYSTQMLEY